MSEPTNGVIYLELDEDITSAIDKLTKAGSDKVQVVTAKRSTLFQSVINLKLLHKAAKDAKKSLVLVTNDRVATNLAAKLGVPVASQVGEAAVIPKVDSPLTKAATDDEIDGGSVGDETPPPPKSPLTSPLETPPEPVKPEAAALAKPTPKGKRVPNIGKMQKRLLWAGAGVLILVLLFAASYFLTSANVALYAQASQVNSSFSFTADPTAQQSNNSNAVLSAQQLSETKALTASVQATGTKDEGSKASGTMTIYNSYDSSPHTLVAGTRFVSGDGHVFLSTADATVPGGGLSGGKVVAGQTTVSVAATANGDSYNLGPAQYTIPGLPSGEQSGIYGQGGQMQGGVTKTVKVIQQSDIDSAQQAALASNLGSAKADLTGKVNNQQTGLAASFQQSVTNSTANPAVGSVADTASLTVQVSYTELAVQKTALSSLAQSQESQQLGAQSQIYDDGSSNLQLTPAGAPQASGAQKFKASATAYAGTKIDTAALAKNLAGQKYGDAVTTASQVPGVTKATVSINPSWATGMPHIASHIHVTIKVSNPSG